MEKSIEKSIWKLEKKKSITDTDEIMQLFIGKWNFVKKENFDEFLKACGIGYILRKTANALTPTEIIEFHGKSGSLRYFFGFFNMYLQTFLSINT